jgi:hypothetical protein
MFLRTLNSVKKPRSRFCSSVNAYVCVGDFIVMRPCSSVDLVCKYETDFLKRQMLEEFVAGKTYGQVTNVYDHSRPVQNEDEIKCDINLYLNRDKLPCNLGHFNSRVPEDRMLVQTLMMIHMDQHDRLVEGLLPVYFVDSLYEPMNLRLVMKNFQCHPRSSSELHRNSIPGFISHPELQYTHLIKVSDAVCNMM